MLMGMCEFEKTESVKWALENGANPNAKMPTGWTALHVAAKKSNPDIISK